MIKITNLTEVNRFYISKHDDTWQEMSNTRLTICIASKRFSITQYPTHACYKGNNGDYKVVNLDDLHSR